MAVITEVQDGTVVTATNTATRNGVARVSQFIDFAFAILQTFLFIRLLLVFFHANTNAGFARFIDTVTNPFYFPFRGLVASQEIEGGFTLAIPIIVAMLVYGLLHWGINRLLHVMVYRRVTVP